MSAGRPTGAGKARRGPSLPRRLARPLGLVAHWMPVWVPLVLLCQIGLLGLRPALSENLRLAERERVLGERYERHLARRTELDLLLRALDDPVYQERLRRIEQEGGGARAGK